MIWVVPIGVVFLGVLVFSTTRQYERQRGYYSPKEKKKRKKEERNVAP